MKKREPCADGGKIMPARRLAPNPKELRSETLAFAATQRSARQEKYAEQNVNDVIALAELQRAAQHRPEFWIRAHLSHSRHRCNTGVAQEKAAYSQQQIDNSENYAEASRRTGRSCKAEIQRNCA